MNRENGYSTDLAAGALQWQNADSCIFTAFWLFFILYIFVCCFFMVFPIFIGVAFAVVFILWLIAILEVKYTSEIDPLAWSTSFLPSCNVQIEVISI